MVSFYFCPSTCAQVEIRSVLLQGKINYRQSRSRVPYIDVPSVQRVHYGNPSKSPQQNCSIPKEVKSRSLRKNSILTKSGHCYILQQDKLLETQVSCLG